MGFGDAGRGASAGLRQGLRGSWNVVRWAHHERMGDDGRFGGGCFIRGWFDTGLRETPVRLTMNGGG